jgi:hypothetical protein
MFKSHIRPTATACAVLALAVTGVRPIRHVAIAATLIALAGAPAVASAATALAVSASQAYSLAGTGSSVPGGGCPDCQAPTMDASGTATCSVCIAGKPASGNGNLTDLLLLAGGVALLPGWLVWTGRTIAAGRHRTAPEEDGRND